MVEGETVELPVARPGMRQRLTAIERRASIVAAARIEFARVGFQGASTASIARRGGCSEPMLYKHFIGKRDLFLAALESTAERMRDRFDANVDLAADGAELTTQVRALVSMHLADPEFKDLVRLRLLAISLSDDEEVRRTVRRADAVTRGRIEQLVIVAQQRGVVRESIDPAYVAWTWLGLLFASCYGHSLIGDETIQPNWLVDQFIDSIMVPSTGAGSSASNGAVARTE